jgi:hypothetical protein
MAPKYPGIEVTKTFSPLLTAKAVATALRAAGIERLEILDFIQEITPEDAPWTEERILEVCRRWVTINERPN